MKSLLDIQNDVCDIENEVQAILASLKNISSDIMDLRNAGDTSGIDYDEIERMARMFEYGVHPIRKQQDERACRLYIQLLITITRLDSDVQNAIKRLTFIQYIKMHSITDATLEDLYKDSMQMDKRLLADAIDMIAPKYKNHFIVDALMVAHICGNPNEQIYTDVADLIAAFGIDEKKMGFLAFVSRVALGCSIPNNSSEAQCRMLLDSLDGKVSYKHYMNEVIEEMCLWKVRKIEIAIDADEARRIQFRWKTKMVQYVEKGDKIASNYKEIYVANNDGVLFVFDMNSTRYGIVSHECDDEDKIKKWLIYNDEMIQQKKIKQIADNDGVELPKWANPFSWAR